jgi:exopolyphosphatase/guanosine-5'-triphosphate,3'-diphosphate pyrophosphatase
MPTKRPRAVESRSARSAERPARSGDSGGEGEIAAVDLGSNSFHMVVAREAGGQLQILDRLREAVRLGAGLTSEQQLSPDAQERAIACLQRFGQRVRSIPSTRVRIVGTNTLRRLRDGGAFTARAEAALGHPIEIISGVEEARLVFGGVTQGLDLAPPRRLVVDIGGGSTELIIGRKAVPKLMESVPLGCVAHTQRFFADGDITRKRMREARLAARVELEFLEHRYRKTGWDVAIGASGTVRGIWRVILGQNWSDGPITREALERVVDLVIRTGKTSRIDYPGLRDDRRPVFAGGLAVLAGVFDTLCIERMETSPAALREGLLFDLLGRLSERDERSRSVVAMAERYAVDQRHARDVERTALRLLEQAAPGWSLDRRAAARLLSWAALLHEIGLAIAHDGAHRHGEYILRNADLFGFSQSDQMVLAALVRHQRGKFAPTVLQELAPATQDSVMKLSVLFRLAILLHRSRHPGLRIPLQVDVDGKALKLIIDAEWLAQHPLTREDLVREAEHLMTVGYRLLVQESQP